MRNSRTPVTVGSPTPLGTLPDSCGVNFAVASSAKSLTLHLFPIGNKTPFLLVPLNPETNRTNEIWHVFVKGLLPPFEYMWETEEGQLLLDPYAKVLSSKTVWGKKTKYAPKGRCTAPSSFNWERTKKPKTPFKDLIIYEMHVRGFTQDASSQVTRKGTFLGLIDKIPHLVSLGVNAVELLPVFEFNENENPKKDPITGKPLCNFWGYSTVSFFSLMKRYATDEAPGSSITEFKTLVRELHRNKIAVILDVVYNHTAEGGDEGPNYSFKGLHKEAYYILGENGEHTNFSGTGNTVNCNHKITTKLIVDSLSYFAKEMQVDGFRFDLASILTRDEKGNVLENPPLLEAIEKAPALQKTHLIAEAWDAAGLYQVGSFPGGTLWAEWNGKYRDVVREFLKGSDGLAGAFADALSGSSSLYGSHTPYRSVNFVTAHDGYSLKDLVSYQEKHNEANGENNQDGDNNSLSWNCGAEGNTDDLAVIQLRKKQLKNFLMTLMLSIGTPMIFMGDEYAHTKRGNNNAYCQDNDLSWFLWESLEKEKEHFQFLQRLIQFRKDKKHIFCRKHFLTDKDVHWHGIEPLKPNWDHSSRLVVYTLKDPKHKDCLIAFNASHDPVTITIPPAPRKAKWLRIIDSSLDAPNDFIIKKEERPPVFKTYLLNPHSALLAEASF
jgi:isoamylase